MKQMLSIHFAVLLALVNWCFVPVARAQMQVNTDGRAGDGNNRVGSAGLNDVKIDMSKLPTGNDIVNNTVTGGWGFRGHVPYFAPGAWHGRLAGTSVDSFIRRSSGVSGTGTSDFAQEHVVYYGQNQLTAPPGFVLDPNTQGYVAKSPLQEAQSLSLNAPLDTTLQPLPLPGQIDTSGQVDPTAPNAQVLTSASPLYGIRQWTTPQTGPQQANPLQTPAGPQPSTGVSGPLSQEQIIQMRQQLYRTVVPPTTPTGNEMTLPPVNPGGNGGLAPLAPGGVESLPTTPANPNHGTPSLTPLNTPGQRPLTPLQPGATEATPLPAPSQQSKQYAQMQSRLQQFDTQHPLVPGTTTGELLHSSVRGQLPPAPGVVGLTPVNPVAPVPAPAPVNPPMTANPPPVAPLHVQSLAEGFSAKGMADLLTNAELMVRDQKYDQAIQQYNTAIQVAPNNPLLVLGRANAELGGLYFVKADGDLRAAITADKTVLMGQIDLDHLYGPAQRDLLIGQLKRIAKEQADNPAPLFLLAYISYNLQDADKAQQFLDLAQKRAGGSDPFLAMLQRYWVAEPTTRPADETNK